MTSRREFLRHLSTGCNRCERQFQLALVGHVPRQTGAVAIPEEDGMIVRPIRFLDLESPVEYLNSWLTPVPHFFVRNHMHEPPELTAADWQLSIDGEVERPLTLSLSDLSQFEQHSVVNTLELLATDAACTVRKFQAFSGARAR